MRTWLTFIFKSIFAQKKLIRELNSENVYALQKAKIKYIKEFEQKLIFLEHEGYKIISHHSDMPRFVIAEMNQRSFELNRDDFMNRTIQCQETILNHNKFRVASYTDYPLDVIKREMSIRLAKELVENGFIQTEFNHGQIIFYVNVYEK